MADRRSVVRRGVMVLVTAALGLALAPPAAAVQQKRVYFEYGKDRSAWYWEKQQDQEVTVPVPEGAPIQPSQRVRLANPQRPDTLPVAVYRGEHERMSALYIDVSQRGVTPGSRITKLQLFIEESQDRNENPSVNVDEAKIQACFIQDFWPGGENEQWDTRPKYRESKCAEGKREVPSGPQAPLWRFDLTRIAKPWGTDPFQNNGLMLQGVLPENPGPRDTWQVNLKIPSKEGDAEGNQYELTRDRVLVVLAFVPGEPLETAAPTTPTFTTTTSPTGSGLGSSFAPSTDFGTATTPTSTGVPAGTDSGGEEKPAPQASPVAVSTPQPRLPGYVWALIPLGLLGLAAVRSAVMEPAAGVRPDGVIAAITRQNAERRGGPLREIRDPWAAALSGARRGLQATGRGLQRIRSGVTGAAGAVSKVARRVRKR